MLNMFWKKRPGFHRSDCNILFFQQKELNQKFPKIKKIIKQNNREVFLAKNVQRQPAKTKNETTGKMGNFKKGT